MPSRRSRARGQSKNVGAATARSTRASRRPAATTPVRRRSVAERRPERARERVAADPQPQRRRRASAGVRHRSAARRHGAARCVDVVVVGCGRRGAASAARSSAHVRREPSDAPTPNTQRDERRRRATAAIATDASCARRRSRRRRVGGAASSRRHALGASWPRRCRPGSARLGAVELRPVEVGVEAAAPRAGRRGGPPRRSRPSSTTTMRSAATIVDSRCAITSAVRPASASASARWMASSDSESRCDVASSRITIAGSLSSIRAIASRCFSPPDMPVAALADDGVVAVGERWRSGRGCAPPCTPRRARRRSRRAWRSAGCRRSTRGRGAGPA